MTNESNKYPLRVAKYIAQSGIASRRRAEKMIYDKRVEVNGDIIDSPALNINKSSIVKVDGEEIFSFSILDKDPEKLFQVDFSLIILPTVDFGRHV